MEQIVRAYGKFFLEASVVMLLLGILLTGVTDDAGNRGIFHIAGAYFTAAEIEEQRPAEFGTFLEEGRKLPPVITYVEMGTIHTGNHAISQYVKAVDGNGQELPVHLLEVLDSSGRTLESCNLETAEVNFPQAGIYTVEVLAVDGGNRRSISQIRLPVNELPIN